MTIKCLWGVLYLFILALVSSTSSGSPVSLTVEGGVSLVGPLCPDPGTTTLLCVGTDLTFLRWRYNGVNDIHSFNTDDLPGTVLLSGPFISATLNEVTQAIDPTFANVTSTLTVNLGELQSVTDIVCGDSTTNDSIPVNVTLLQPTAPAMPNITSIIANYQSTDLSTIKVSWRKLVAVNCTTFLHYDISVGTGLSQTISHTNCTESLCIAMFNTLGVVVTDISLRAVNDIGASGTATYHIEQHSEQYFTPQVTIADNCEATLRCAPGTSLSRSTTCSVRYTSDPTYMGLSDPVTGPLNITFPVQRLQPNTVYYFVFSVMVNDQLNININLQDSSGTCDVQVIELMAETVNVAAAVAVPILLVVFIIVINVILVACWFCKKDNSLNMRIPKTELHIIADILCEIWLNLSWLSKAAGTPYEALRRWHVKQGNNATYRAIVENLKSAGYVEESENIRQLALYASPSAVGKFWNTNEVPELKVHFMNPDMWNNPDPHTILEWAAKGWNRENSSWPRISEEPCGLKESHIRVKFLDNAKAQTWSLVGADAIECTDKPTMYLCLNTDSIDDQKSRVIHEFGHALGLEHEHQRSDVWEVLQKVCDKKGLKKASFDFSPTEERSARAKLRSYDPDSIMHFWMDHKWLKPEYRDLKKVQEMTYLLPQERKVIEGVHKRDRINGKLAEEPSEGDFEALRQAYSQPEAETSFVEVQTVH